MSSITQLIDRLRDEGLSDEEIEDCWLEELAQADRARQQFIEDYEDDPVVQDGYRQQDLIDLRRFEQ